jgi:hypothetical protein
MPDSQHTPASATSSPKNGSGPAQQAAREGADQAQRQVEEGARTSKAVIEKTAEASQEALQANQDILRSNFATAQSAMRSAMDDGVRNMAQLRTAFWRAAGVTEPNEALAEQSARNVRAVSQASTALAKGAQDAVRTWVDLTREGMRKNVEAVGRFAGCRSMQDLAAAHSELIRDHLQSVIDGGQAIARTSTAAIEEANRAMRDAASERPPAA